MNNVKRYLGYAAAAFEGIMLSVFCWGVVLLLALGLCSAFGQGLMKGPSWLIGRVHPMAPVPAPPPPETPRTNLNMTLWLNWEYGISNAGGVWAWANYCTNPLTETWTWTNLTTADLPSVESDGIGFFYQNLERTGVDIRTLANANGTIVARVKPLLTAVYNNFLLTFESGDYTKFLELSWINSGFHRTWWASPAAYYTTNSPVAWGDNGWHTLVFTHGDDGAEQLVMDGAYFGTNVNATTWNTSAGLFRVGNTGGGSWMRLKDLVIYNTIIPENDLYAITNYVQGH